MANVKKIITLILIVISIYFVACNNINKPPIEEKNIEFVLIGQGELSGSNLQKQNRVINNVTDWQNFIATMDSFSNKVSESFSETDINFSDFDVIVAIDSIHNSMTKLTIDSIIENSSNVIVFIQIQKLIASIIVQPYCIVKVPKITKPVIFN